MLLRLLPLAVLVACSDAPPPGKARAAKQQAAESALSITPVPRTYRYADGELRVLEVPVVDESGFLDRQRCFVWRDETYRTATISCGQTPDVLLAN